SARRAGGDIDCSFCLYLALKPAMNTLFCNHVPRAAATARGPWLHPMAFITGPGRHQVNWIADSFRTLKDGTERTLHTDTVNRRFSVADASERLPCDQS
ncbi:hypothetical protein, partial [Burkholderia contaminans]|uniref:hypothetical protein n=1 Tax=Burkholderia contaminans TaxID=488447 RepID=UPI001C94E494